MRGEPFYIDPAGGLNTRDSILSMEMQYTPDCLNVVGSQDGSIRKRYGCPDYQNVFTGAGANDLKSLHASNKLGFMLASAGTKMYSINSAGVVVDITGAAALTSNAEYSIVDAVSTGGQGPVFFMPITNIGTVPYYWNGAGNIALWNATAGTMFQGDHMVYFKNRMIQIGKRIGTDGCGVIASKVGDPSAWDTSLSGSAEAWLTNIEPSDGEAITALGTVGPYLLVFKAHKIYVIYDLDTGANRPLSTGLGCVARKTIQNTPYGTIFVATDGHVYITNGSKIEKISDVVDDVGYATIQQTAGKAMENNTSVAGVFYNDHYYVTGYANVSQYSLDYNFQTKTWWRHSNVWGEAVIYTGTSNWQSKLFSAVANPGGVGAPIIRVMYEPGLPAGSVKDGASNFQAQITTIPLAPSYYRRRIVQNYSLRRRYHAIRAYVSGSVNLTTFLNRQAPVVTNASYVSAVNTAPKTVYSLGVGYSLTVKWDSTNADPWKLAPFTIYTQPRTD